MDGLLERIIDAVLSMRGTVGYVVIGLLAFGEAAAFLGLITPGELAMILGGVLVSRGHLDLTVMLWVAAGAAAAGDSAGYWLGRRFGHRLTTWEPLQRRLGRQIQRTERYFRDRGGQAVAIGRWASVAKVFVPFVAGASQMTYPRFLLFSLPSAAIWAMSFVVLGYLAGQSWHLVERYAGRASLALLLVIAIGLAVRWAAKKAARNPERVQAWVDRFAGIPPVRWLRERYGRQLRWLGRRFDPTVARGLGLTLGWLALLAAVLTIGYVLNDIRVLQGLVLLDGPVRLAFDRLRTPGSATAAHAVLWPFRWPGLIVPTVLAAAWAWWRAGVRPALRTVVGALGGAGVAWLVQAIVEERVAGTQFPSVPVTVVTTLAVHLTAQAGTRLDWVGAVRTAAGGVFVTAVVGVAALLAEATTLSGAVFAFALGVAWAAAIEVQSRMPFRVVTEDTAESSPLVPPRSR